MKFAYFFLLLTFIPFLHAEESLRIVVPNGEKNEGRLAFSNLKPLSLRVLGDLEEVEEDEESGVKRKGKKELRFIIKDEKGKVVPSSFRVSGSGNGVLHAKVWVLLSEEKMKELESEYIKLIKEISAKSGNLKMIESIDKNEVMFRKSARKILKENRVGKFTLKCKTNENDVSSQELLILIRDDGSVLDSLSHEEKASEP